MSQFSTTRIIRSRTAATALWLFVVVAGVTTTSSPASAAPGGGRHSAGPSYSYGRVTYSPAAVRTPFGVAARGSAYAAPNGPVPKSGYSYGAVKYGANAVKTPWGVMSKSCHRTSYGISCM
jgi:hypothetical protein